MDRIASFSVNHDLLEPGIYLSRVDGDIFTYDLRFIKPNTPPFLSNIATHTIEHLFATFARNSKQTDNVIYFGPMGCRTGFYLLLRGMSHKEAIDFIKKIIDEIIEYEGDVPGNTKIECGNYKELDLEEGKKEVIKYKEKIKDLTEKDIYYKE